MTDSALSTNSTNCTATGKLRTLEFLDKSLNSLRARFEPSSELVRNSVGF